MADAMDWAEIKMLLRDGTSVDILADLNGVPYKTMYNRIMAHQIKDNVTYLTPKNTRGGMQKSKAISKTKQAQAKAKEKKAEAEKVGREIVEGLPKFEAAPEEKPDIPEPVGVVTECGNCGRWEEGTCTLLEIKLGRHGKCKNWEPVPDIPEEVYNMRRQLQPETIEELKEMYRTCLQLAERYQKQAEDWKKIIDTFGTSHPVAQGLPEVDI